MCYRHSNTSSCIAGQDHRSAVVIFLTCMCVLVCRPKLLKKSLSKSCFRRPPTSFFSIKPLADFLHIHTDLTLKPPSHVARMKQNLPELTVFEVRVAFGGEECHFERIFLKNAVQILRIHFEPASNDACTFRVC